jgi:hypothetical protein
MIRFLLLFSCVVFNTIVATGQVILNDPNPNIVIEMGAEPFELDIDLDGEIDIIFHNEDWYYDIWMEASYHQVLYHYGYDPDCLKEGTFIYQSPFWKVDEEHALAIRNYDGYWDQLPLCGDGFSYLGIKLIGNGGSRYAWIRMKIDFSVADVIIDAYAFQSIPGVGIVAGEMPDTEDALNAFLGNGLFLVNLPKYFFDEELQFNLVNVAGERIWQNESVGQPSMIFEMGQIPTGFYILTVSSGKLKRSTLVLSNQGY